MDLRRIYHVGEVFSQQQLQEQVDLEQLIQSFGGMSMTSGRI
jgi:hypothetical protein